MATILIYPDTAQALQTIIEQFQAGDFQLGQLTLTDKRGTPVDLVFQSDEKEVGHE